MVGRRGGSDRGAREAGTEAARREKERSLVKLIGTVVANDAWKRAVSSRPIFSTNSSYTVSLQEGIVCPRYTNDVSAIDAIHLINISPNKITILEGIPPHPSSLILSL